MNDFNTHNEVIFTWSIGNFSFCSQDKCKYICSPTFFTKHFHSATWRLFLYPKGSAESRDNYIAINLSTSWPDYAPDSLSFGLELGLVDGSGLRKLSVSNERCQFWRDSLLRYSNFASRDKIFSEREDFLSNDILTIQCHIWGRCSLKSLSNRFFARTVVDIDKCVFRWGIKNFDIWDGEHICIPVPLTSRFQLDVYFRRIDGVDETIGINICQLDSEMYARILICTMSLVDTKGNLCECMSFENLFPSNATDVKWSFPVFVTKNKILQDKYRYLKKGTLGIQCEIVISTGKLINFPIDIYEPSKKPVSNAVAIDTLKDDLRRMYAERRFTDVILKTGEEAFDVHKALLSVRSPVFRAMFEQDMAENQSGTVDIPDLDAGTLNSLLTFMYSGILEDWDCESISKLLVAADKYQVLELREKCAVVLKSTLSVETVCQVLVLANFQEDKDLKDAALDFICANSRDILQSNEWFYFMEHNRKLTSEVLCKLSVDVGIR